MSEDMELIIDLAEESVTRIEFPSEHLTVSTPCTQVGHNLFRLDGVPTFAESAGYRDIIEAEPVEGGTLRFVRVAEPSGWRTYNYILWLPSRLDGDWGQCLLRELEAQGGYWELQFGGLLYVCIPPGVNLDPTPWVETL